MTKQKYLLFYPDGNVVQQTRLLQSDIENSFVCDIYIYKYDKGKYYVLVDEGNSKNKDIWQMCKIETLPSRGILKNDKRRKVK